METTSKKTIIDITHLISPRIDPEAKLAHIFVRHTTCALAIADMDPGAEDDYLAALKEMLPEIDYRHPHDPSHMGRRQPFRCAMAS